MPTVKQYQEDPLAKNRELLKNPSVQAMLRTIRYAEGTAGDRGYNTRVGNSQFDDLSKKPGLKVYIPSIKDFSSAEGAYQFLNSTWEGVSKKLGLKDFSPESQDLAAVELIKNRGALQDVLNNNLTGALTKLSGEWASLPTSKGKSAYSNQKSKKVEDLSNIFYGKGVDYTNSVAPYINTPQVAITPLQVPEIQTEQSNPLYSPTTFTTTDEEGITQTEEPKQNTAEQSFMQDLLGQMMKGVAYIEPEKSTEFQDGGIIYAQNGANLAQFKKKPFQLQSERNQVQRDNTNVQKQQVRPLRQLNVRNKTDKEIAQEREAKIQASVLAQKTPYTQENWREQLAAETAAIGDKLRFSNEPNAVDDSMFNPVQMIAGMASNLGQAPLQAQQTDSNLPYLTSIGAPLAVGAIGGLGTKTTGQFVNNLVNPLAGFGVKDKVLDAYRISKEVASNPKIFLAETGRKMMDDVVEPIVQYQDRKNIKKIFNSKLDEISNPESISRLENAGINSSLFLQDLKKTKLDFVKQGSSMFKFDDYTPILNFDINQAKRLRQEGYNFSNEAIIDHEIGHLMQPIEFRNQKGIDDLINMNELKSSGSTPTSIDLESDILLKDKNISLSDFSEHNRKYFSDAYKPRLNKSSIGEVEYWQKTERLPFLRETKRELIDVGFIKNINSEITPQIIKDFRNTTNGNRILSFLPNKEESFINLSNLLNKTPAIAPIAGASYLATQGQPKFQQGGTASDTIRINDTRKIRATTNKPINPNVDLVTGDYKSKTIEDIVNASLRNGVDPDTALALAMQESKLGNIDENLGHIVGGSYRGEEANDMTKLLSDKMYEGRKLGKRTDEQLLQMYNGTGKIFPTTEQDYHGFKMKQAYGVPIPKEGIDMSKTPLYGKQVIDIRDNVIKKNKIVADTVKNLKGNFNHFEGAPYKKLPPMGEEIFQPNAFNNINPKYFQKGGNIKEDREWLQNWYQNRVIPNEEIQNEYFLPQQQDYVNRAKNLKDPKIVDQVTSPDGIPVEGVTRANGDIEISKNAPPHVQLHEMSHSINKYPFLMGDIHKNIVGQNIAPKEAINNEDVKKYYNYYSDPEEIHARIQVLRKEAGIKPDQKVTHEFLQNYLKTYKGGNSNINDLLNVADEPHLIEMLNYMADNSKSSGNIQIAQQGGTITGSEKNFLNDFFKEGGEVIEDNNGYWNPNNWGKNVKIDGGEITMEKVGVPLVGRANTGETKLMLPEQNYSFRNATYVIESPLTKEEQLFLQDYGKLQVAQQGINPLYKVLPKEAPTIESLLWTRPDLKKGEGIYYGEGDNKTFISPSNILSEVVVKAKKKQRSREFDNIKVKNEDLEAQVRKDGTKIDNKQDIDRVLSDKISQATLSLGADKRMKELNEIAPNIHIAIKKSDVIEIQKKLYNLGYDLGDYGKNKDGIDGLMGKKTKEALDEYNRTKGVASGKLSLEQEERIARFKQPTKSNLDNAVTYLSDKKDEVVGKIKEEASTVLPYNLKYNPKLDTVGEYNNNSEHKYLLDNKSLSDIRKEKNISFLQISKDGRDGNTILPLQFKERVVNSTNAQGYAPDYEISKEGINFPFFDRLKDEKSKTQVVKGLEGDKGNKREDIYRMYSGLPQKNDTFTASSFKAGKDSDTNVTFKNPKDVMDYLKIAATHTDLFEKLASGQITPQTIANDAKSNKKGAEKINKAAFRDPKNVMWNATFGVNFDKQGNPYLSFYDNWDLKGKDDNVVSGAVFGKPIEVYDRIPLSKELVEKLGKLDYKFTNTSDSDALSETDEKANEAALKKVTEFIEKDPKLKKEYEKLSNIVAQRYK
jgi:muramidase (phage lysozyme)